MRALIATAGLFALAGAAAAALPQPLTLRHSSAPIAAVTQDGSYVAWLAGDSSKCNVVHVLAPSGTEVLPQPTTVSMTCHWDLSLGQPQLALAAGSGAALWTLHESGSIPFDYVMAAKLGGREVPVDRLAHASDGTGWWLGSVAGAGTTLAYSSVDVEYVDKLGCLTSGSCKKTIAGGGIHTVSAGQATPLPGSAPALDLAVSTGRIAYVPATEVAKSGAPAANRSAAIEVVDAHTGAVISQADPTGLPLALGLAPRVLAVLTRHGRTDRVSWYDVRNGAQLGKVSVPRRTAPQLAASNRLVVFRAGRLLRGISLATGRIRTLARAASGATVGFSLAHGRLVWAENLGSGGRLLALPLR